MQERREPREDDACPGITLLDRLPGVFFRQALYGRQRGDYYSRGIERLTGHRADALAARGVEAFLLLVHPDDRGSLRREWAEALRAGRPYLAHYRLVHRDGSLRHVREQGVIEGSADQALREGSLIDETEAVWAEKTIVEHTASLEREAALLARRARLLQAVTSACEDLVLARSENDILRVAAESLADRCDEPFAAALVIGLRPAALGIRGALAQDAVASEVVRTGSAAETRHAPERQEIESGPLTATALTERRVAASSASGDLPGKAGWRERHQVRAAAAIPLLHHSQAVGALFVAGRHAYREAEVRAVELLARQVVAALVALRRRQQLERDSRRHEEQIRFLEQARHDLDASRLGAEQASERKSRYLAHLSHEIRTPLHGVLGTAELLATTELDTEQADLIHTLRRSADSLLRLLNQVLTLSRMEAGFVELSPREFDPFDLAEEALEAVHVRALSKKLRLEAMVAQDVPRQIRADAARLRQVVTNLLSNAIKFTDCGSVVLRVGLAAGPAGEAELRVSVEDTGCGIDPGAQRSIFEPFVQTRDGRAQLGTGLGLAICREIAKAMGGELGLDSVPGRGSVFYLQVPLHTGGEGGSVPRHGETGLVLVADAGLTREVVESWARCLGVRTTPVQRAEEIAAAVAGLREAGATRIHGLVDGFAGEEAARSAALGLMPALRESGLEPLIYGRRSERAPENTRWIPAPMTRRTLARVLGLAQDEERPDRALPPNLDGVEVLAVDDDPVSLKLVRTILERAGARVATAEDAAGALEQLGSRRFDLALLDLHLPGPGGLEIARQVREAETRRGESQPLPLIALTGGGREGERAECLRCGMNELLLKPIRLDELLVTASRWAGQPSPASR